MTLIIAKKTRTPLEEKRAQLAASEFRPSRYTSGSARLDNMVALNKAVLLCDTHARKFNPKAAHYMLHPDPNMSRAIGRCDVCQVSGLQRLYLNEKDGLEQLDKLTRFKSALEYATILNG